MITDLREYLVPIDQSSRKYARQAITSDIQTVHIKDVLDDHQQFLEWMDQCFEKYLDFDTYDSFLFIDRKVKELDPTVYHTFKEDWNNLWGSPNEYKNFWLSRVEDMKLLELIRDFQPFRKRGCFTYNCIRSENDFWKIQENGNPLFEQQVEDIRSKPRQYTEIPVSYRRNDDFLKLLAWVAELTFKRPIRHPKIQLTCHMMRTYVQQGFDSNPAPEGVHRDGANYIVSGLVLNRKNVVGGTSTVYLADGKTQVFSRQLNPGEGLFQADEENLYWHSVSSIKKINVEEEAYRSIIGFDMVFKN
ncbi:MAG: 2OG-Fe dioxygenase family protein [Cytophagales bacterium]|nr:2OG-Fe dioxygenase family protein [Cytophagales bacterium]